MHKSALTIDLILTDQVEEIANKQKQIWKANAMYKVRPYHMSVGP